MQASPLDSMADSNSNMASASDVLFCKIAGDRVAVTCAGDSEVRVHDLTAGRAMEIYT